jgi:hypothetical protein
MLKFFALQIFLFTSAVNGATNSATSSSSPPTSEEWRAFIKAPPHVIRSKWTFASKSWGSLHWQWRMAWVRRCEVDSSKECDLALSKATQDDAAVIRSSAATALGRRHSQTGDRTAIKTLVAAFDHPRNKKGGQTLFVYDRILWALNEIGGPTALKEGKRLANKMPKTSAYWLSLSNNRSIKGL